MSWTKHTGDEKSIFIDIMHIFKKSNTWHQFQPYKIFVSILGIFSCGKVEWFGGGSLIYDMIYQMHFTSKWLFYDGWEKFGFGNIIFGTNCVQHQIFPRYFYTQYTCILYFFIMQWKRKIIYAFWKGKQDKLSICYAQYRKRWYYSKSRTNVILLNVLLL